MLNNLELWQTEWCPASHRVRQRLTELGLTYTVHQVPVERDARAQLEHATGRRTPASSARKRPEPRKGTGGSMSQVDSRYPLSTTTELGFTNAVTRVREELANEGFGILDSDVSDRGAYRSARQSRRRGPAFRALAISRISGRVCCVALPDHAKDICGVSESVVIGREPHSD